MQQEGRKVGFYIAQKLQKAQISLSQQYGLKQSEVAGVKRKKNIFAVITCDMKGENMQLLLDHNIPYTK